MMNSTSYIRLPAEWEPQDAVLVSWPHSGTDWNYMLEEAQECYVKIIEELSKHSKVVVIAPDTSEPKNKLKHLESDRVFYFDVPTNDTWIRDYGVITTIRDDGNLVLNDFEFNGWGGKFESQLDNEVTSQMFKSGLLQGKYTEPGIILEGGSIESDGKGTILTTSSCLLTPTRNNQLTKSEIEKKLADYLGAKKILWLDAGEILGDDTDGHIDTIARFAPNNTIIFCGKGWGNIDNDTQSAALVDVKEKLSSFKSADGCPYNLIELPMPDPIYDKDDMHRLPATYANFLIINDAVLLPVYGQPQNDRNAEMTLKVAFPEHEIVPVDCRALIRQHGSLHCATMQIPRQVLPF